VRMDWSDGTHAIVGFTQRHARAERRSHALARWWAPGPAALSLSSCRDTPRTVAKTHGGTSVHKPRLFMTGLASSAGNGETRQHQALSSRW